ncbi:MAG: PaaI family thioesterase [Verrucomicrobiota bacterium]
MTSAPFNLVLDQPQGPLPFVPRADPDLDGGVVWEYVVDSAHFNPYASLHGGVVMALMDSAMGHIVAAEVHPHGRFNAAAQMNVNFLAPVRSGVLRARARILKLGKRLAVVEAWVVLGDGTRVATATATHSLLP